MRESLNQEKDPTQKTKRRQQQCWPFPCSGGHSFFVQVGSCGSLGQFGCCSCHCPHLRSWLNPLGLLVNYHNHHHPSIVIVVSLRHYHHHLLLVLQLQAIPYSSIIPERHYSVGNLLFLQDQSLFLVMTTTTTPAMARLTPIPRLHIVVHSQQEPQQAPLLLLILSSTTKVYLNYGVVVVGSCRRRRCPHFA